MGSLGTAVTLLTVLLAPVASSYAPQPVFLDRQQASSVISRHKRENQGDEEKLQAANLERECLEEVCQYEEAREVFKDSYRTDIFWSVYVDGDQCAEKPCKNGAMCLDSIGGYDCICKSGFSGVHCEKDETVCVLNGTQGCSQFCKPGYGSYVCSCARGWKLDGKDMEKCVPAGSSPCGQLSSSLNWENRQKLNAAKNFEGLPCGSNECPWQAILRSADSAGFCSGVILKSNLVLTSAQCASVANFTVAVGKRVTATDEAGQQSLTVLVIHLHPRYVAGRPDNDLAVLELRERVSFGRTAAAACLPERDFADSVLTAGPLPAVVTGWKPPKEGRTVEGDLSLNFLSYEPLAQCVERHPALVTNKMGCTAPQANADCAMSGGSPLLTQYRNVFFLTGVVSQPPGADCSQGYVFQKVSRFQAWLQNIMDSR